MSEANAPPPLRRSPVQFTRRFGPEFSRLDNLANASIGCRDLGHVKVDCKFRLSKTRWGALGAAKSPAGILYMDLVFEQPKDCQLRRANVEIILEEVDQGTIDEVTGTGRSNQPNDPKATRASSSTERVPDSTEVDANNNPNTAPLQLTDFYGPKQLVGEPTEVAAKKSWRLTPELNILGYGGGGVGHDRESNFTQTSRWTFTGQITTCAPSANAYEGKSIRESPKLHFKGQTAEIVSEEHVYPSSASAKNLAVYRRLKWSLEEDDFQSQAKHNNVIHTAFTFQHERKPFYIRVNINGKLQRKSDRLKGKFKRLLKFPVHLEDDQGKSTTLVRLDEDANFTRPLDPIAQGLARSMELANLDTTRVQMPDALPVSFQEEPSSVGDTEPIPAVDKPLPEANPNDTLPWKDREPRKVENSPSTFTGIQRDVSSRGNAAVLAQGQLHQSLGGQATSQSLAQNSPVRSANTKDSLRRRNDVHRHDMAPPNEGARVPPIRATKETQESELDLLATQISQFPLLLSLLQWVIYMLTFLPRSRKIGPGSKQSHR